MNKQELVETYSKNKVYFIVGVVYIIYIISELSVSYMYPATMRHEIIDATNVLIISVVVAWIARNTKEHVGRQ